MHFGAPLLRLLGAGESGEKQVSVQPRNMKMYKYSWKIKYVKLAIKRLIE